MAIFFAIVNMNWILYIKFRKYYAEPVRQLFYEFCKEMSFFLYSGLDNVSGL